MANWHICEDPYPGPYEHTWADEIERMGKSFRKLGVTAMHANKRMKGMMARLVEHDEWRPLYEQMEKVENYFHVEPITETPRERALRLAKTRSTGPKSEWIFDRDRTRRY